MSALNASIRSIRAPLQAIARRHYSSAGPNTTGTTGPAAPATGYSKEKVLFAGALMFAAGVETTAYYFMLTNKKEEKEKETA
ncbi:hypothetical protein BGX34_003470 [Mortierella sp. NVP85]|nr:hypothetical protein BGX34_003470 [Mortierella sp. NVP85]